MSTRVLWLSEEGQYRIHELAGSQKLGADGKWGPFELPRSIWFRALRAAVDRAEAAEARERAEKAP